MIASVGAASLKFNENLRRYKALIEYTKFK